MRRLLAIKKQITMAITMEELKRKARAYDEAIESAKEIVNNQNASSIWKDWLRNTFPGEESTIKIPRKYH